MITKFNATLCPLRQVLPLLELQNLLIVESLHFAMFTSPGHKYKHYDDVTHTSCHPLFACQSSSWRRNYDRYCSSSSRWLGAQTEDSDCDWLKQLKRFTDGAFFGWNKIVSKQFQCCYETFSLHFHFVVQPVLVYSTLFCFVLCLSLCLGTFDHLWKMICCGKYACWRLREEYRNIPKSIYVRILSSSSV